MFKGQTTKYICNLRLCMVNYNILYKKFVEQHVIKLILLKIPKLSAHLTQAIIRDKLQRLKHARYMYTSINYNVQMRARAW